MALHDLLAANAAWAHRVAADEPGYFVALAEGQAPEVLWLGCSDSRVPPATVTGTPPGSLFVHRNIANQVVVSDTNFLSVLTYAVESLGVKHIVVCGHDGCGGVRAALGNAHLGPLNEWLRPIKHTYQAHRDAIEARVAGDADRRVDALAEASVVEQVHNLSRTSIVQRAWHARRGPSLHGWMYGMHDGRLRELIQLGPDHVLPDIYRFDFTP